MLFEPLLRSDEQSWIWCGGYAVLVALVALCASSLVSREGEPPGEPRPAARTDRSAVVDRGSAEASPSHSLGRAPISLPRRLRWITLSAVPSSLLLGTTTFITTDIAAVPLLWVVPLAIYLLTFILVFASKPLVSPRLMVRLQPVVVLGVVLFMLGRVAQPVGMVLAMHLAALFVSSMVCHGAGGRSPRRFAVDRLLPDDVARRRDRRTVQRPAGARPLQHRGRVPDRPDRGVHALPEGRREAESLGLCPAHRDPRVSGRVRDGHAAAAHDDRRVRDVLGLRMLGFGAAVFVAATALRHRLRFALALAALFAVALNGATSANGTLLETHRSFFGIHRVVRNPSGPFNDLFHGTTVHGRQLLNAPDRDTRR